MAELLSTICFFYYLYIQYYISNLMDYNPHARRIRGHDANVCGIFS